MSDSPLKPSSPDLGSSRTLEIAHVLFTDIVGYSKLPMDEQESLLMQLQDAVRHTPEFARAEASEELIRLPTGDGMALVFFRDPEAPVRCALELSRILRTYPEIKLRMGIHSGPVYRVADINANRNVAGGGINIAQRVMDCGDAGHILVSEEVANVLGQLSRWKGYLQNLGEAEVKHSVRVQLFNLYTEDAGNSALPQKFLAPIARGTAAGAKLGHQRGGLFLSGIAIVVLLALAGYALHSHYRPHATEEPFQNFTIAKITDAGNLTAAAISPDGKYVVNVMADNGMESLWLRNLPTNSDTQVVAPTRGHYLSVQFSPDGNYMYFGRRAENGTNGGLYRAPILGGSSYPAVTNYILSGGGFSFSPDGRRTSFFRYPTDDEMKNDKGLRLRLVTSNLDGGEEKELVTLDSTTAAEIATAAWSPDGKVIVIDVREPTTRTSNLIAVDSANGKQRTLISSTEMHFGNTAWLPDGSGLVVLYSEAKAKSVQRQIGFVSFPEGKFRAITKDTNSYAGLSVSRDGKTLTTVQKEWSFKLYMMPSRERSEEHLTAIIPRGFPREFAWVDEKNLLSIDSGKFVQISDQGKERKGLVENLPPSAGWPAVCQGGRYIAFTALGPKSSNGGTTIWRLDTTNNQTMELTYGTFDVGPVCSPDGKWVYYVSPNDAKPVRKVSIDGGPFETVSEKWVFPVIDVSHDGKLLAYFSGQEIGVISSESGKVVKSFPPDAREGSSNGNSSCPRFTPDNKALAYTIHVGGVDNIWAQPIDGTKAYPITSFRSDEIMDFHWSPSGDKLGLVRGRTDSNVVLIRQVNP
jgi:Tol biopolymer transport system component/class 3 adenylate cyclase